MAIVIHRRFVFSSVDQMENGEFNRPYWNLQGDIQGYYGVQVTDN